MCTLFQVVFLSSIQMFKILYAPSILHAVISLKENILSEYTNIIIIHAYMVPLLSIQNLHNSPLTTCWS